MIIGRTLIVKILLYLLIMIQLFDLNIISLSIVAFVDVITDAIHRTNNIDLSNNQFYRPSFLIQLYNNSMKDIRKKITILVYLLLIFG